MASFIYAELCIVYILKKLLSFVANYNLYENKVIIYACKLLINKLKMLLMKEN